MLKGTRYYKLPIEMILTSHWDYELCVILCSNGEFIVGNYSFLEIVDLTPTQP